jgi:hypothetical protein
MAAQLNPVVYGKAIQYQLANIVTPVPVYAAVYTGTQQSNKGIDRPVFQISIFTQQIEDGFTISNQILQALHGYSGILGSPSEGFYISKADVMWLYNSYNDEEKLAQIFLDCTIDIPA